MWRCINKLPHILKDNQLWQDSKWMYAQEAPSQTGRAGGAAAGEGVVQVVCETAAHATPAASRRVPAALLVQQLHHCQVPTIRCDVELADTGMLHEEEQLPAAHTHVGYAAMDYKCPYCSRDFSQMAKRARSGILANHMKHFCADVETASATVQKYSDSTCRVRNM